MGRLNSREGLYVNVENLTKEYAMDRNDRKRFLQRSKKQYKGRK